MDEKRLWFLSPPIGREDNTYNDKQYEIYSFFKNLQKEGWKISFDGDKAATFEVDVPGKFYTAFYLSEDALNGRD